MAHDSDGPLFSGMRGVRYGEILVVYLKETGLVAEVFGTQMLNDCPQEAWDTLDSSVIAADMGAVLVKLNGPRYWVIDAIGQKVPVVDPVLRDFNGLTMRRLATVDLGENPQATPYTERKVNRGAAFLFDAGTPVYQLVDPAGSTYIMQSYCISVDPTLTEASLAGLGERLTLPPGWTYRTRLLADGVTVDTTQSLATVLQDEFENSYTLPT